MFWRKRYFISYFCFDDNGKFYLGNTMSFCKTGKITPEFIIYVEHELKEFTKCKDVCIIYITPI